ncbi:MAG: hypothetical protein Kow0010_02410 [Dehalococcoidia bacterium]
MTAPETLFLFDLTSWDDWQDWLVDHGIPLAGVVIGAFVINFVARRMVKRVVYELMDRGARTRGEDPELLRGRADTLVSTIRWAIGLFLAFLASGMVLAELGLNVTTLIAGVGVLGIALGLGAQTLVRDVINGLFILVEDQYSVGDVVSVGGKSGVVVDINPRRTVLRDLDGNVHSVPNSIIDVSTNMTRGFSRINIDFQVAYKEDLGRVIEVINDVCRQFSEDYADRVIDPPKVLRVNALGASGVDIRVLGDVKPASQWELMGELRRRMKDRFDQEGIEIPFPHTTVYFRDEGRWGHGPAEPATPARQEETQP